jgi:hypothetical protein
MRNMVVTSAVVGVVLWSVAAFGAGKTQTRVELVDPGQSVAEALHGSPGCQIITDNGKIYRVCPLILPPSVKAAIARQSR